MPLPDGLMAWWRTAMWVGARSSTGRVMASYHGTLRDGRVFDSSYQRGQPLRVRLTDVIPCWREGLVMMKAGGRSKISCPASIAYGDKASGLIRSGAALSFQIELLDVVD